MGNSYMELEYIVKKDLQYIDNDKNNSLDGY